MSKKRKAQNKIELTDAEMLKPIDIELFGSKDDPCFGKLYDLSAPECKRCGDSEICCTVVSQRMNIKRDGIEGKHRFKDLELEESPADFVKKHMMDLGKVKVRRKIMKKYSLSRMKANKIIRELNDN